MIVRHIPMKVTLPALGLLLAVLLLAVGPAQPFLTVGHLTTLAGCALGHCPGVGQCATGAPLPPHFTALLTRADISWTVYAEGIDGRTCPLTARCPYAPKRVAALYFDDVTHGNDPHAASCIAHVRPYTERARPGAGMRYP